MAARLRATDKVKIWLLMPAEVLPILIEMAVLFNFVLLPHGKADAGRSFMGNPGKAPSFLLRPFPHIRGVAPDVRRVEIKIIACLRILYGIFPFRLRKVPVPACHHIRSSLHLIADFCNITSAETIGVMAERHIVASLAVEADKAVEAGTVQEEEI